MGSGGQTRVAKGCQRVGRKVCVDSHRIWHSKRDSEGSFRFARKHKQGKRAAGSKYYELRTTFDQGNCFFRCNYELPYFQS